jgi:hypothetical protein
MVKKSTAEEIYYSFLEKLKKLSKLSEEETTQQKDSAEEILIE